MTDTDQQNLDVFAEMNRYDDRDADWKSSAVYEPPRRTLHHGWRKFHAARDCGAGKISYIEETTSRMHTSEKYEFRLLCYECGYQIPEEEVLFIGGDWFNREGIMAYGRSIEDLRLPADRVLELGPDPDKADLVNALELTRIERECSFGTTINATQQDRWNPCEECEHEVPMLFDGLCRMCYEGPWTENLQRTLDSFQNAVRTCHNNSFVHRLEQKVDPLHPAGTASPGTILWRRHDMEGTTKLVEVTGRLEDQDDGHVEYVLEDPTRTDRWQYRAEGLEDCFWDTGLHNDINGDAVLDDRIREVWQRVCAHTFRTVYEPGSTEREAGEQCLKCKKRREVDDAA